MAESSLRAARSPTKGGLPNLLFAVALAERPPAELCRRVDEISILFPWGSLLRGALALDAEAAAGIAALIAPGGRVEALVSVARRDSAAVGLRPLAPTDRDGVARRWRDLGLEVTAFRAATTVEIAGSASTLAKRLAAAGREAGRPVWRVDLRCRGAPDDSD